MKRKILFVSFVFLAVFSFFSCATLQEPQKDMVEGWLPSGQNVITSSLYDEDGFDYFGFNIDKIHYKTKAKTDEAGNTREFYKNDYTKYKPYKIYYKKRISQAKSTYSAPKIMHTGPRGGRYYINSKGKKVYQRKR